MLFFRVPTDAEVLQIGVARHRGIDIIVNEVSNRATPYVEVAKLLRIGAETD